MHVVLGVCGGISAYKSPELVRLLKKQGHRVTPVLTKSALQFVSPLALEVVSEEKVVLDEDRFGSESLHLKLAREADCLVIAPATANSIAKFANGIADDMLSTLVLSWTKPRLLVPAMHTEMWENSATQRNIKQLQADGFFVLGPVVGDLASGDFGQGRMVDLSLIVDRVVILNRLPLDLSSRKIVVTSGGTIEPLDSVRALTNFSTGMLGRAIATVAAFMGAKVTLVSTQPVENRLLDSVVVASTVLEMQNVLEKNILDCDTLIMAAAVSDFRPKVISKTKLKRDDGLVLDLEGTPDILKGLYEKKNSKTFVGFCLADEDLETTALKKLESKSLDYIVANSSEMFGKQKRSVQIYKAGKQSAIANIEYEDVLTVAYEILSSCLFLS